MHELIHQTGSMFWQTHHFFFAVKETDINLAILQKGPKRQKIYKQALLQVDHAGTTKPSMAHHRSCFSCHLGTEADPQRTGIR
jgi:hypothetical protein